jgi:hypothetical protein
LHRRVSLGTERADAIRLLRVLRHGRWNEPVEILMAGIRG